MNSMKNKLERDLNTPTVHSNEVETLRRDVAYMFHRIISGWEKMDNEDDQFILHDTVRMIFEKKI